MRLLFIRVPDAAGSSDFANVDDVSIETVHDGADALEQLGKSRPDAVLARFPLPGWTPEDLLEALQRVNSRVPVVIHDRQGDVAGAIRLTRLGAFHYFAGDVDSEQMAYTLEAAAEEGRSRELSALAGSKSEPWRKFLVGDSRAMEGISQIIRLIGPRRCTVLITGETGTGKEMVARAIHLASGRGHLPMVTVNCAALPENLLEAELFGHTKGAFTGAIQNRVGRFEQAHKSTIFLDEIGDMPLDIQAKLLRVLQEREFERIGSSETIKVDVRVIAATNVDLVERIREGGFREDLYYRLNVVPVPVPPLRERLADIAVLVRHFVEKICRHEDLPVKHVPRETLDRLARYAWPGNVRQLENAVERALALSGDRDTLYPGDFSLPVSERPARTMHPSGPMIALPDEGLDFEATVGRIERGILEQALRKTNGNKKQAADMLRLKRTTLAAKLRSLETVSYC